MTPDYKNSPDLQCHRAPQITRPNLIFIRAGAQALWPFCNSTLPDLRSYDIAVSYFDTPACDDKLLINADYVFSGGLSKYHAAYLVYKDFGILQKYNYICFADDDIEFLADADVIFKFSEDNKFAISQCSLTSDSFFTWNITRNHPGFSYRTVNFIELMAPIIKVDFLKNIVEVFPKSISTWRLPFGI